MGQVGFSLPRIRHGAFPKVGGGGATPVPGRVSLLVSRGRSSIYAQILMPSRTRPSVITNIRPIL
jgi:hypothetical protein